MLGQVVGSGLENYRIKMDSCSNFRLMRGLKEETADSKAAVVTLNWQQF